MMHYAFTVEEVDASSTVQPIPHEPEKDFLERVAAADDKNFMALTVVSFRNGRSSQKNCQSPYFLASDPDARATIFKELMKRTAREILEREEALPPDEEPPREPLIVVP